MADFDIEAIVKPFVADVGATLKGLEAKCANLEAMVFEMEQKSARDRYFGSATSPMGEIIGARLPEVERKQIGDYITKGTVISGAVDGEGGFLVPLIVSKEIERLIELQSPLRQVARVVPLPGRDVRFPVANSGMDSGWVAEKAARPNTATPDFYAVQPPGGELYAAPQMTLAALEDAAADLEGFIQTAVVDEMSRNESEAFINGNGVDKPRGFLNGTPVATPDAGRTVGVLQYVATGTAGTLGADLVGKLVAMVFATKAGYRQAPGCAWMMSTAVLAEMSNLKDTTGRPLFVPSLRENVPGTLLGYPVIEAEQMAAVGAGNFPVAFGNWQRGYIIGDRTGLSLIRDPYTTRGFVTLYWRKRVHGAVLNSEAVKLLKVAVS